MKVCHFSKKFSSQNKLILNIQSSIELSHIKGILSNYSEVFLFFAKYGFLFENVSLETESSKSKHAPVESTLSTPDPARDGGNWYGYAGQNPVNKIDPNGLTTLDDFVYQKRTEATDAETYAKTFQEEIDAAIANQGLSDNPTNRYNDNGSPKNPTYEENQNKINYFVHVYESEQSKLIHKTFKQKELERKYGYGNFLCLITSILNAYVSDGVVTNRFMDREFGGIIRNNLNKDGCIYNMEKFSRQIASSLGLGGYYNYCYDKHRNLISLSEVAFRLSEYKYGIGRFLTPATYLGNIFKTNLLKNDVLYNGEIKITTEHFGLYRNSPYNDYINPGYADDIGNYILLEINPLCYKSF